MTGDGLYCPGGTAALRQSLDRSGWTYKGRKGFSYTGFDPGRFVSTMVGECGNSLLCFHCLSEIIKNTQLRMSGVGYGEKVRNSDLVLQMNEWTREMDSGLLGPHVV